MESGVDVVTQYIGPLWPLILYFFLVLIIVGGMVATSYLLGERHRAPARDRPYESGIVSTGTARQPLTIKFYLVAMFFVVFDLEAVFIVAWALATQELGWAGYIEILVFIGVLVAALAYLWKMGALDWGTMARGTPARGAAGREVISSPGDGRSSAGDSRRMEG